MKENKIKVLKVDPSKYPEEFMLENELEAMQEAVGGYIDIVSLEGGVCILLNDEGKLIGLEGNRRIGNDMFSVPRGYSDGFVQWCKQVIALCLTAFLQTIVLVAGLVTYNQNALLGIGLMLSSMEVPRIAQNFGLDTSTRFNVMSTIYSTQSMMNMAKSVSKPSKI